jgi:aspartokinase/homoserine dehydrogenase 1
MNTYPTGAAAAAQECAVVRLPERKSLPVKVLKFGGSSLATPDRIAGVARIVLEGVNGSAAAIVVSAFQGITDQLLEAARLAGRRDAAYGAARDEIVARHRAAVDGLFAPSDSSDIRATLGAELGEMSRTLQRIYQNGLCPPSEFDAVASFGERLSALIVAAYLNRFRPARFVDARQFVITDGQFTRATVRHASTARLARQYFSDLWDHPDRPLAVVTGFIGSTIDGRTTTVGRNGSDYTAAVVGAALGASAIEIWTDVDGVLSADPRAVSSAFVIPRISYEQAQEMSEFGAKVVHPSAVACAVGQSIPILIKNTFNPDAPGTLIQRANGDQPAIGISSMPDLAVLSLGVAAAVHMPRTAERVFRALADRSVKVVLACHASPDQTTTVVVSGVDADSAADAVGREFAFELHRGSAVLECVRDQAIVAAVGNEASRRGLASRMLGALGRHGIPAAPIGDGGRKRSIACIVDGSERSRAVNVVHQAVFSTRKTLALAVIGVGNVGRALLQQIAGRQAYLREQGFDLSVVAIANSKRFIIEPAGISLGHWADKLQASGRPMNASAFATELTALDLTSAAVVDCTAADAIVDAYPAFVDANLHIITPNKRAHVLPWPRYKDLLHLLRLRHRHFLYEATVGAGLPVVSTLHDLVASGDRIVKVEGIVSGTLSYLFNVFDGKVPFSEIVRNAHRQGLTEPDPREDLTGLDVARKLLILAREAGAAMNIEDVRVEPLIDPSLSAGPFSPRFFAELAEQDAAMSARVAGASSRASVLRYVATLENGEARARLQEVPCSHPLAATRGADNSIAFTTDRYCETPLVVQGPGAGPLVTAMGVFSDILKLLRYVPE